MAVENAKHKRERSDYYVFWKTGQSFTQGKKLYHNEEIPRNFYYPPFAAFLFQLLAVISFQASAIMFFLINAIALPVWIYFLLRKILIKYGFSEKDKLYIPIVLSFLFSFNYFWSNLNMLQINLFIFSISLLGILYLLDKKHHIAAIALTIVTFIKIYPVFLLLYVFLLKPDKKMILAIFLTTLFCVTAPSLQRGLKKGFTDHVTYYETFLKEFKDGKIVLVLQNHNAKTLFLKAVIKEKMYDNSNLSNYKKEIILSNVLILILLATMIYCIFHQFKKKKREFSFLILSMIFIFTHMISGISWSAHYVTAIFWYLPLFLIDPDKLKYKSLKIVHYALLFIALFLGFEGKDTTGQTIYLLVRKYDIYVIFPVLLYFYYAYLYLKDEKKIYRKEIEPFFKKQKHQSV